MSADLGAKKQVRLSIYNQEFSLLVSGDDAAADLRDAADEVDGLMATIARSGNMDSTRVAILACLHLQDRVRTLERELAQIESKIQDRTRRLSDLLDKVVHE